MKRNRFIALTLSMIMLLSMVYIPTTVSATTEELNTEAPAYEDWYFTFDGDDGASGVFGTQGTYEVYAGNATHNGWKLGLSADDDVVMLNTGTNGSSAVAGSYLNGTSWGDATPWEKGTLKFDIFSTNTWLSVNVLPTRRNCYGVTLKAGASQAVKALTNGWTEADTGLTYSRANGNWMEIACEFDIPNDTYKLYVNGEVAYETTEAGFDKNYGVPADWQITGGAAGNGYAFLNNLYFYEGGYEDAPADLKYIMYAHKYTFDDNVTTGFRNIGTDANDPWEVVAGTVAGKDASNKVLKLSSINYGGSFSLAVTDFHETIDFDTVTASVNVYQPSTGNGDSIGLSYYTNYLDTTGIEGNISLGADGSRMLQYGYMFAITDYSYGWETNTIALTDPDATQLDEWHELAITMTKSTSESSADGTIKYYIDGTLVHTQTGLQIDTFTKDIRVQSIYGNDNGSIHYIDDYMLYEGDYVNWNGQSETLPTQTPTEEPTEAPSEEPTETPAYEDWHITFDGDDGASGVFGTAGTYEVYAGNDSQNGYSFGLSSYDDVVKLYTGTKGSNMVAGSYLNGTSWGDDTPWEKGTLKFDIFTTNTWFDVNVLPTARNRYGVKLKAGSTQAVKALTNGWTEADTGLTYSRANGNWMEIACEFDIPNDTYKLYVNGEVAYETTEAGFDKNHGVPADWQITGSTAGNGYAFLNNLYFYEGGYEDAPADPEYPSEAPTEVPTEASTEEPTETPTEAPTEAPIVTVTFVGGDSATGTPPESITGELVTMPENPFINEGYKFAGWYTEVDGEKILLPEGADYTVTCNTEFTALWVRIQMETEAQVRVASPEGLRFVATINADSYSIIKEIDPEAFCGTLICPLDYFIGYDFTTYWLDKNYKKYLDVRNREFSEESSVLNIWRSVIANIHESNYNREFAARGYIVYKFSNGERNTIYADFDESIYSESISNRAKYELENNSEKYTPEQLEILRNYAQYAE